jgi:hypothetical protein
MDEHRYRPSDCVRNVRTHATRPTHSPRHSWLDHPNSITWTAHYWDVSSYSLLKVDWRFRGVYCFIALTIKMVSNFETSDYMTKRPTIRSSQDSPPWEPEISRSTLSSSSLCNFLCSPVACFKFSVNTILSLRLRYQVSHPCKTPSTSQLWVLA